ncbi:hypothetical protein Tco_0527421 [Tanacetum coccineum]
MHVHGYTDDEFDAGDDNNITLISKLDVSNPLHLHPNDSVALTVVSVKLKGTENYQVWSCAIYTCHAVDDFEIHNSLMKLMQFLMGLDDTHMQIRSSILSRETLPDVRSAYAIISNEESHRVASGSIFETSQRSQTSAYTANLMYSQEYYAGQGSGHNNQYNYPSQYYSMGHGLAHGSAHGSAPVDDDSPVKEMSPVKARKLSKRASKAKTNDTKELPKEWTTTEEIT